MKLKLSAFDGKIPLASGVCINAITKQNKNIRSS